MAFVTNLTTTLVTGVLLNGVPSGVNNDKGTITNGGAVSDDKFSARAVGYEGGPESITIVSGVNGTIGLVSSYGFNTGTEIQMHATETVAGSAQPGILGGSSNSANDTHAINQSQVVSNRYIKTAIRSNKWNEVSGSFDVGFPHIADTGAFSLADGVDESSVLDVSGTDVSANPSPSAPGRLTFQDGSNTPVNTGYDTQNSW